MIHTMSAAISLRGRPGISSHRAEMFGQFRGPTRRRIHSGTLGPSRASTHARVGRDVLDLRRALLA